MDTSTDEPTSPLPVWHRAAAFAAQAHAGQTRPDGRTPFIVHPTRVARIVSMQFGCDEEEVIASAFLHDVLEKSAVQLAELTDSFGQRIATMVNDLSKDPAAGNDDVYYEHLKGCDWQTRLIKLADALDHIEETEGASASKLEKGTKALKLAFGDEAAIVRGRQLLTEAVEVGSKKQQD